VAVDLIFETHSITHDNEDGIATGWLPGSLSEAGQRLALELGERRILDAPAVVLTSDLARAVETATSAFGHTSVPIHEDPRLRECDYGDLNGITVAALDRERLRHLDEPFPRGESYRQVAGRVAEFLDDLRAEHDGETVVAIGHSATKWSLDHLLLRVPLEDLVVAPFDWRPGWSYRVDETFQTDGIR
jgi:alpha-ribazole phosphatase/probable phosphoglycerate mutase